MTTWRYENPGRADLLTVSGGTTLTNLPSSQSATGVAFYQPNRAACFGIAPTKELWLTCDIYTTENYTYGNRIRIYSEDGATNVNGFSTQTSISAKYQIWHNGTSKNGSSYLSRNQKRPFLMHMISDATNGLIKCVIGDEVLSYTGNVNNGNDFANFYIQMDGGNIWVSNLIISNEPIQENVSILFDTWRSEYLNTTNRFDTERRTYLSISASYDTKRKLNKTLTSFYDAARVLSKTISVSYDTKRQIPHNISDTQEGVLQSVTISTQEQQLTDNVSFVLASDINILEGIAFRAWDYTLLCVVEEVSKKGVLSNCKCTVDIDEIIYKKMAYKIPESAFEWTAEYNEAYASYNYLHPDKPAKKMPSAPASAHITAIAGCIGKNVSIQFSDWISTMAPEVKSGTNYAGLIAELFGWTARLPHLMINCYVRGNTLYAVQRGHEQNTVNLDGKKLTVHTINKKIMRLTWGSDPESHTDVAPIYDSWMSDDLTPFPHQDPPTPGGGGTSQTGMNHLVKETEVTHGEERVVTNYHYTDMGGGKQFLDEETTKTYIGGSLVDEVHTYHKPVSFGQAQVYSTDDDGVLGTTVSPSNFDERITPYQYDELMSGGNGYTEAFVDGAHDAKGNYFPAVYDGQGNRYIITGHTAHKEQIGSKTRLNAYALVDTSFPVDGYDKLEYLTSQINWLNRKTEESVTLDIYDYPHFIDFNDKIIWQGNTYYLRSNTAVKTETIVNKQTIEFVRWY